MQWFVFLSTTVGCLSPIHTRDKSADESQTMYASFLQLMGTQYSPEKIKGKRPIGLVNEAGLSKFS
jgi:hypothetical protein